MRSIVVAIAVVVCACGGSTASGGAVGGSDAQASGDATSDAAACVTVDPTTYDRSCAADGDCTLVASGTLCTGGCGCGGATIAKSDLSKYEAATAQVKLLACPCPSPGVPRCVQGTCVLCSFGPGSPPGCPDGG